ncbi:hypothetical protein NE236_01240 [Actinoallomurus purpureus]|uniref:hypothetical protein n=1 Tax=Actinoallomurus purpureus TaxID=478114 RepID=UPI0020936D3F|nr:hypothetical protein [Actinoallomurus purpureus]MCO6003596.1 hypothetical protein [Actinoallomurus purpureus]
MKLQAALLTALLTSAALAPQAMSAQVPAASQTVCMTSPTPTGWVVTGYSDWYACGTPSNPYYNSKAIMDATGTPSGGSVTACMAPGPAGFYATAYSYSFSCEITKTPSGTFNNQEQLTNLNGRPSGTTVTICGIQSAPSGWVQVAIAQSYLCVYARSGGVGNNAVTIRKS